jgi:hypothetical protein
MRMPNRGQRAAVPPPNVSATKGYKRPFYLSFLLYFFTMQSYRLQPPTCAKLPTYISPCTMFFGRPPTAINLTISAVQSLPAPPRPTHLPPQVRSPYRYLHRERPQRHHERSFLRISLFNVPGHLFHCTESSSTPRLRTLLRARSSSEISPGIERSPHWAEGQEEAKEFVGLVARLKLVMRPGGKLFRRKTGR